MSRFSLAVALFLVSFPIHEALAAEPLNELHLLQPFWKSPVVYRESVLFLEQPDGSYLGRLLFRPSKVLTVERADRTAVFQEGHDFKIDSVGRGLAWLPGSKIPKLSAGELYPPAGKSGDRIPQKADNTGRYLMFDNAHRFHDLQVEITYEHASDKWEGAVAGFGSDKLPKTIARLKNRLPLKIGVSGDSISAGYNASAFTKAAPGNPPYPDLVAAQLRSLYGGPVELVNRAVSGWNVHRGLDDLQTLLDEKPNLVIIAYGMNDVGKRDPGAFAQGIRDMLRRIKARDSEIEVMLVSPMLGNPDWIHTPTEMFPKYRAELAALEAPGVAFADLTTLWQALMKRKGHLDVTGNGVNHPNDFGHRLYASVILELLIDPSVHQAALPAALSEVTRRMMLPPGFTATLFAGEPQVVQPIAFTFDDRGRMWVVECLSYPEWKGGRKDRVVILEDADGDGQAEKRTVFWDQGRNLSGIALGFGGVWLCSTPELVFVPDENADDRPDGPPVVKLDGWDIEARHNVFNSLTWGPDGWLYGCNGILSNSKVGKPGTRAEQRKSLNCGVWRYHPLRGDFEPVAHGTTNPWGLDFDDYGQMFITNCVIKHAFHVIPGAHYERMFGQDIHPHSYGLIESCADHIHWAGGLWTDARGGERHDAAGGGHAHSGAAIYRGDNFPAEYRNRLMTCNIHGNRVNQDALERHGSGYVATHKPDLFRANDPWFRGVALHVGPDGALYVADWSDTGECHNYLVADRSNGRIVRIAYGNPVSLNRDLARLDNRGLIELLSSHNDWLVGKARRLLQERASAKPIDKGDLALLREKLSDRTASVPVRLRMLWALAAMARIEPADVQTCISDSAEDLRGWGVRLASDSSAPAELLVDQILRWAYQEPSPRVLLEYAAALQRLPIDRAWAIAEGIAPRIQDASDPNLPWMFWYGFERLVVVDPARAAAIAEKVGVWQVRQSAVRRMAGLTVQKPEVWSSIFRVLKNGDGEARAQYLTGLELALEGRRRMPVPPGWAELRPLLMSGDSAVRSRALRLSMIFGDAAAERELIAIVDDRSAPNAERLVALDSLIQAKPAGLSAILERSLDVPGLRLTAIQGLATVENENVPKTLVGRYPVFSVKEQEAVIAALASRAATAGALLQAIGEGKIPRAALNAYHIQQLQLLPDKQIGSQVAKLWGSVRPSPAERSQVMEEYKRKLSAAALAEADAGRGRALFNKNCASCHRLFDAGGQVGPELTGAQRTNLDYILQNVIDPSAVVPRDYQVTQIQTSDGRVVSGIVKRENEHGVVLQTATEQVTIPIDEIESRRGTGQSMMPDKLWTTMSDSEWRDLVKYLGSPNQVPAKAD